MTTFLVIRHFLMSSTLAVRLRGVPQKWLSLYAYGITDPALPST